MARIEHAPRLDQQQLNLILGIRFVLNALRDNKHFTDRNVNGASHIRTDPSALRLAELFSRPWLAVARKR